MLRSPACAAELAERVRSYIAAVTCRASARGENAVCGVTGVSCVENDGRLQLAAPTRVVLASRLDSGAAVVVHGSSDVVTDVAEHTRQATQAERERLIATLVL